MTEITLQQAKEIDKLRRLLNASSSTSNEKQRESGGGGGRGSNESIGSNEEELSFFDKISPFRVFHFSFFKSLI